MVQWIRASFFLWVNNIPSYEIYHTLFICLSVDGHLGCLHFWAIVNNAAVNMCVHVFVWMDMFSFPLELALPNQIVTLHLTFWGTARFCHPQCMRVPPHVLLSDFLALVILNGYELVSRDCVCIFSVINDVEHFFMCFMAIYMSTSEKCLFQSFVHFWTGLFVILLLNQKFFYIF